MNGKECMRTTTTYALDVTLNGGRLPAYRLTSYETEADARDHAFKLLSGEENPEFSGTVTEVKIYRETNAEELVFTCMNRPAI